jgi:tetratricopeptide (TPR) repeat protein
MSRAYRKNGQLHEAKVTLDQVTARDPAFAGLDIEYGLYFEAQGDYGKAVERYRNALEGDPENTDLLLRLGAAQVENGEIEAANETLQKVIRRVPNSAEAEYFIGRINMAQDSTPESLIHFDRAIGLDPGQAEFHIWAGKAALEMKNIGRVNEEAQKAIDIDASLGEAFLLRGLVRVRAGTVKSALKDFNRALELKPSLNEAYAYMGECYDQLRKLDDAVRSYRKALEREQENGEWWFKLGRLLFNGGRISEAGAAFGTAARIGDKEEEPPYWLAEAHRTLGEVFSKRNRRAAITHYLRFLELASEGSVDREPVKEILKGWRIEVDKEEDDY